MGFTTDGSNHWRDKAACLNVNPMLFFPERGRPNTDARLLCARCPVQAPCLEFALEHNERFGIWGGTVDIERRRIKKQRNNQLMFQAS